MVRSFPPNPWTQQFYMPCVAVEAWHSRAASRKDLVYITRETFRSLGFAEATISDFMRYLRTAGVAAPIDDSYTMRNCLSPTREGLLATRKYLLELESKYEKSRIQTAGVQSLLRLGELVCHIEETYRHRFGDIEA